MVILESVPMRNPLATFSNEVVVVDGERGLRLCLTGDGYLVSAFLRPSAIRKLLRQARKLMPQEFPVGE